MRLDFCVACGERDTAKLEHHHMIPRSAGGSDEEANLITLCHVCHGRFHGYERQHIRALSIAGQMAARARGVKVGNPACRTPEGVMKLRAAREAVLDARIVAMAETIVPVIQAMRPLQSWDEVAAALNATGGLRESQAPWTRDAVIRTVKRLIDLGVLGKEVLPRTKPGRKPKLEEPKPAKLGRKPRPSKPPSEILTKAKEWQSSGTVRIWSHRQASI